MKKVGVALLTILVVNSAFGANWVKLGESKNKVGGFTYYIDTNTVLKTSPNYPASNNGLITYFIKMDFKQAQKTADGEYYNWYIDQWKGDCQNNRISLLGYIDYTKDNLIVKSRRFSSDDWDNVLPNSSGEKILNTACKITGYRQTQ